MSISYQYRTYIATFLPFRAYSIDNQLIIDTQADFSSIFQFHKGTIETCKSDTGRKAFRISIP